jgi:uncharacterized protein (TIGR02231 family)
MCIPKYNTNVFLTAKVVDWAKYNLLDGEARLYFEGTFVGNSDVYNGSISDTLYFSLGSDKKIGIERKRITAFSKKTFLSGKKTEQVAWEITIRNNKKTFVDIVVKDNFPVPVKKEIEVKREKVDGAEVDAQTGIVTWNIHLEPTESKKLELKYAVTYPKDKYVIID